MRADAGAHGVDALHGGANCHLGTGTGFPGDVADLHLTVGDLRGLQLEQAAHQIVMGAGDVDQRAAAHLVDFQHVHPDHIALVVGFAGDLLAGLKHGVGGIVSLADAQEHVAGGGVDAQHGAGHQLLCLVGIAFVSHAPLGFPDALNDHLLGGLGGDAAEFLDVHGDVHRVAHLNVGVIVPGGVDGDLQRGILHLLHGGLDDVHGKSMLAQIDHHIVRRDVPAIFPVFAVGVGQRLFQTLHHIVHRDALELFQLPQRREDLRADVHLGGFRLLFGCLSCHFILSSYQNSTRSRTSATSDFSNVTVSLPASTVSLPSS